MESSTENDEIADIFAGWNKGELNSYLIGITADICRVRDTDGGYLLDRILDIAGQKGTGKWTAEAALEESDPLTLITEAVHARFLSAMADERSKASALYRSENNDIHEHAGLPDLLRHALCTGILFVEKSFRALSMEFRLRHVG